MKILEKALFKTQGGVCTLFSVLIVFAVTSCSTNRNLVYFSNLPPGGDTAQIVNKMSARIEKGDILGITITTLSPEYNQLFNSGAPPQALVSPQGSTTANPITTYNNNSFDAARSGFLVDENGQVNLPVLGKTEVAGLTRKEAQDKITGEVAKTAKTPIVNIKFLNYKVTVIGEVAHPGSFTVPDERVNLLEALGMAGDLTPYAIRENVLVIREKEGTRTMQRINLADKNIFNSPYFYLQQNDVVYVQPENNLKAKQADASNYRWVPIATAGISAIAVILASLLR
ncbi:polysaccharide biosynthesis/export family protein [Niabella drilacis]|uniref:Polysaccharide export outer membrane protein n=1 Tax=Niabella drilacis (strain DSM 25811 / CCM 8410 / CCUG 62505 / LMG 26954 / E90) TaxID=1285928 RepID=A0A1G6QUB4_NIADE|nr:polysaccharide biosynthesis/export family protein [Niabella drilacis]SDC96019.1 polysaccharide export outer membrane protein [Niabella drilacis]